MFDNCTNNALLFFFSKLWAFMIKNQLTYLVNYFISFLSYLGI